VDIVSWDAIGAIGEIIGSFAVLITLIYLATQIRNQNRQARDANRQWGVTQFNAMRLQIIGNAEVARVALEGQQSLESLTHVERFQFSQRIIFTFSTIWSQYQSVKTGTSDLDLEKVGIALEIFASSTAVQEIWISLRNGYPDDFVSYVDSIFSEGRT
jgi:hypothetical protein